MTRCVPSDESIYLELAALSTMLYDCINMAGVLGPTFAEYDHYRNPKWVESRSLLRIFGLPTTRNGWTVLLNAYSYESPSLQQVQQAAYRRIAQRSWQPQGSIPYDDDYPELPGVWRETVEVRPLGGGAVLKTTRRIFQPR